MKKVLAAVMLTSLSVGASAADGERNGQFIKDNGAKVWSEASKNWLTPENF